MRVLQRWRNLELEGAFRESVQGAGFPAIQAAREYIGDPVHDVALPLSETP